MERAILRPSADQFAAVLTGEGAARQKDRALDLNSRIATQDVAIQRTFVRIGPAAAKLISDRLLVLLCYKQNIL